jgi:regulator of sirC expression with transglutaminase-like and TPR domain
MTSKQEIESLIFLLDDPDEFVKASVIERFESLGESAVPILDQIRVSIKASDERKRIDDLLLKITFPSLEQEFLNYLDEGIGSLEDLEHGLLLLARIDNPTIRPEHYTRILNQLAAEIEGEINYTLQPVRQLEILSHHIFLKSGYSAAREEYFDPKHTHLHSVIDGKAGIPLTLSLIMLFVARRLELPLSGINMPIHFLMRFDFDSQVIYIDPFNFGKPVSMGECLNFLKRNNIRPEQDYFTPASPLQMLLRSLRNIHNSYVKIGDEMRANCLMVLITHFETLMGGFPPIEI